MNITLIAITFIVVVFLTGKVYAIDEKQAKIGEMFFKMKCMVCHDHTSSERAKSGPPLWDVYGRGIGNQSEFNHYSIEFKKRMGSIIWTDETLNKFLYLPIRYIPGNYMAHTGIRNETERMAIVEYLKSLKDKPSFWWRNR